MMNVVVRTHGGLGNQIFQLLYARLYARTRNATLCELHDLRYQHAFARSDELSRASSPGLLARLVSFLRLPKIATRLKLRREAVGLFHTIYLDGYFQRVADYAEFDDGLLKQELDRLRVELGVASVLTRTTGMHLRLGDFFATEAAVLAHLDKRLKSVGAGAGIITNEEHRLASPAAAKALKEMGAHIVPTGDMKAEQVLRTLASFSRVDGNDSTLLFWASVLSGMECEFSTPELRALRSRFLAVLATQEAAT